MPFLIYDKWLKPSVMIGIIMMFLPTMLLILIYNLGFIRRSGGISKCLTASGFTEAWLRCGLSRASEKLLAENLGQGLTRPGLIGGQEIP